MPNYRRARIPGASYFFTVVSHQRHPILCDHAVRSALHDAVKAVQNQHRFTIDAWVLLPDHLHCIWTLPVNDHAYSMRWSMIKRLVTQMVGNHYGCDNLHGAHGAPYEGYRAGGCNGAHGAPYDAVPLDGRVHRAHRGYSNSFDSFDRGIKQLMSVSRKRRREGIIWQRRFWEHRIRDQADLNRCLDCLHWNPVKHGYVDRVVDWPYSTIHRYIRDGVYPPDWGGQGVAVSGAFGE